MTNPQTDKDNPYSASHVRITRDYLFTLVQAFGQVEPILQTAFQ